MRSAAIASLAWRGITSHHHRVVRVLSELISNEEHKYFLCTIISIAQWGFLFAVSKTNPYSTLSPSVTFSFPSVTMRTPGESHSMSAEVASERMMRMSRKWTIVFSTT